MKASGNRRLARRLVSWMEAGAAVCSGILLLFLLAAFVLPLVFSLLPLFTGWSVAGGGGNPGDGFSAPPAGSLVFSKSVLKVAARTLWLALLSTIVALLVGIPAAFFTATRSFPGRRFLLSLSAVPLCLPPLLVALGYVMFWGMQGVANRLAAGLPGGGAAPFTFLYSAAGIVLAQGFYNFPLAMKTCGDSWSQLPTNQQDAAVLLGASPLRVFRTITLVQLLPAIATSAMVVFLYCFFSFVLVLLFGGVGTSVLEVEIYQAARSSLNFPLVAALALVETMLALAVVGLYGLVEGSGRESRGLSVDGPLLGKRHLQGWKEVTSFALLMVAISLFFFLPLFQLIVAAFTARTGTVLSLQNFADLFSRPGFYRALKNTLVSASLSSALAVIGALAYSFFLREWEEARLSARDHRKASSVAGRKPGGSRGVGRRLGVGRILPLLPMAVSSVVLAVGATSLTSAVLPGLRGSPWMLVLLQAALHWPLAFRQISDALDKIPRSVEEVAALLAPFPLDNVFRVYLPLCRKRIVASLGFCFALGCGDTTLPLVLAIPRFETLALYTYNLAGSYRFYEACCSGVVLALLTMPIFFVSGGKFPLRKGAPRGEEHG